MQELRKNKWAHFSGDISPAPSNPMHSSQPDFINGLKFDASVSLCHVQMHFFFPRLKQNASKWLDKGKKR